MPRKRQFDLSQRGGEVDIDALPQLVVGFGRDLVSGQVLSFHHHRRTQLIYASDGVMSVRTREADYVIPPLRAVWMPGGVEHRIEARSDVKMRTLYIDDHRARQIRDQVCVLQVSGLLRALIIEAVAEDPDYEEDSATARLMLVILDQIRRQNTATSLTLPMPTDTRLRSIVDRLIDDPGCQRELVDWAPEVGASLRTLVRLFPAQTGMTFRQWRQQRRLMHALELLAAGDNVTRVALELGYNNTSAFIAMFRRSLGTTPAQYFR